MSILNLQPAQFLGVTTFSPGTTFDIAPVKGQVGWYLYSGSTGVEIAAFGQSYATQGFTVVAGVTTTFTYINSTGSSIMLAPNGKGIPVFNTTLDGKAINGGGHLWGTAASASLLLTVGFFCNDAFPNN
jgi:hypothetical protein